MESMRTLFTLLSTLVVAAAAAAQQTPPAAPPMPAEYAAVLQTVGRQGDFKDHVLKVNVPRSDLKVVVDGVATPTPFGFGGWFALTKGDRGMDVMMGDLVLTEAEVNPVMSAVLDNGLDVTALHNHFLFDTPRIFYMHVHGHGTATELANKIKPALALIGKSPAPVGAAGRAIEGSLGTEGLSKTIGFPGEQNGAVYKITIGRSDFVMKENGRNDKRAYGPQHMGGLLRDRCGCGGRRRCRDAGHRARYRRDTLR